MKRDYDANPSSPRTVGGRLYKYVKIRAESGNEYYDVGQFGAWMYQVTGKASYAQQSFGKVEARFLKFAADCQALTGNIMRDLYMNVGIYDWTYNGLSPLQRNAFLTQLNNQANCVRSSAYATSLGGFKPADMDTTTTGAYWGVALLYETTKDYNPTIVTIWDKEGASRQIGGYLATAIDGFNRRNLMKLYATVWNAGGEYSQGSDYGETSYRYMFAGWDGIRTIRGTDSFPEIASHLDEVAEQWMASLMPCQLGAGSPTCQRFQWGDTTNGHTLRKSYYWDLMAILAGLTQGTALGGRVQDWVMSAFEQAAFDNLRLYCGCLPFFNPYAPRGDYHQNPKVRMALGHGLMLARTGWTPADSALGVHFPQARSTSATKVNASQTFNFNVHPVNFSGELQWWVDGTWALTHPIGYISPNMDCRGSNSICVGGLPAHYDAFPEHTSVPVFRDALSTDGFVYVRGTNGGTVAENVCMASAVPPVFNMENSRAVVYFPASNAFIVHDRVNALDPKQRDMTRWYSANTRAWMLSRTRVKEFMIHTPVAATLGAGYSEWAYSGKNMLRVTHLLPTSVDRTVEDQSVTWPLTQPRYWGVGSITPSERKFDILLTPHTDTQWDTFLNVFQSYVGTPMVPVLVRDARNWIDGVFLPLAEGNRLVAFNAVQGPNLAQNWTPCPTPNTNRVCHNPANDAILDSVTLRRRPFSLRWDGGSRGTKVILTNLDSGVPWEYAINGGVHQALTIGTDGVAVVGVTATGSIALEVFAGNTRP